MLKVALTGGIATGKSYVRARIAAQGVPTVDADVLVHQLFGPGTDVTASVARRFGTGVVRADGRVDRKELGAVVFGDPEARRELEAIVHPRVYEKIAGWAAEQQHDGALWILADIPLLFETRHEGDFDRVIVAACPRDDQVRRVMLRDRLIEADAFARVAAQWPIADKVRRATDVIDTGGSFEATDRQIEALCLRIAEAADRT
jgi:dephospho-CoA kinase